MTRNSNLLNILILIVFWCVAVIIVNPIGNFPVDDDWAYARVVQSLCMGKGLQFPGEVAIPFFTQAIWGLLFCKIFWFSFSVLRFSSLLLGLIGVFGVYLLLRSVNASHKISFLGAITIAVNPIYFALSYTFMTDIFFFTLAVFSFYFFSLALISNSNIEIALGVLLCCIATLCRQIGIIIPLSFGIVYIFRQKNVWKAAIKAFLPVVITAVLLLFYQAYLKITHRFPAAYNCGMLDLFVSGGKLTTVIFRFMRYSLVNLLYIGLFLLPFLLIFFPFVWKEFSLKEKKPVFFTVMFACFVLLALLAMRTFSKCLMPLVGNTLITYGIGPLLLFNYFVRPLPLPFLIRLAMTALSVAGAGLLFYYAYLILKKIFIHSVVEHNFDKSLVFFFLLQILFFGGVISLASGYCDRYQIILFPLVLCLAVIAIGKNHSLSKYAIFTFCGVVLVSIYGLFSVVATHDYLSWNRARWEAVTYLVEELKVKPNNINAGQDINAWYSYDPKSRFVCEKRWWWYSNITDNYVITFGPVQGYKEIKRFPYRRWFPFKYDNILALQKT